MKLKLDPRQRLHVYRNGDVVVTDDPQDYPDHVADLLLQSRRNGLPLVTEVEDDEPAQPWSMSMSEAASVSFTSDDEDTDAGTETSDDDE